jgi:cell division protein FtsZ
MNANLQTENAAALPAKKLAVTIFGVGNAGVNVLEGIAKCPLPGASFVAVNAAADSPAHSSIAEKISVETKLLRGLGTGGDPERGHAAAEEFFPTLKEACAGAAAVFIVAGLGGGAGTGISPVLARAAKEAGALVLAFVTLPFDCEGNRRQQQARRGLELLKAEADGVICLPNQKMLKLIDENTGVIETFRAANELLAEGVGGVWRLMARKGLIEIHFSDLCALLRDRRGESCFATAEAAGATRSREAVDKLLAHPMLDGGKMLAEADAMLVSLTGGPDLTMAEVSRVMEHINGKCSKAQVIMGAAIDESFRERLAITLVATRRGTAPAGKKVLHETAGADAGLSDQLLDVDSTERPQSRLVPPPPEMTQEKAQKLMTAQTTGPARSRKMTSKMRQGQLQLDIISKGRFDKSEPTIHKGEDLDTPTFIRRGVALN